MSKLKLDKAKLRMEKTEIKVEKAEVKMAQRRANKKLYEKAKPSDKLHEKAKPSDKLSVEKRSLESQEQKINIKKKVQREGLQKGKSMGNTSTKDSPLRDSPLKDNPLRDAPLKDNPLRDVPFKDIPLKDSPLNKGHIQRNLEKLPANVVRGELHREISKYEEDNVGLQAIHQTEQAVEQSARYTNYTMKSVVQKNRLRPFNQLEEAQIKLEKAEKRLKKKTVNYQFKKYKLENSAQYSESSLFSKWKQKQQIKKNYAREFHSAKMGNPSTVQKSGSFASNTLHKIFDFGKNLTKKLAKDPKIWVIALGLFLLLSMISAIFSTGMLVSQVINSSTTVTTYTADDDDMLEVEGNYQEKETALQNRIDNIESEFSGYDEYRYNLSEIGHDPHDLAALLTALYHAYTPSQVSAKLDEIFAKQYNLTITPSVEVKYDAENNPYDWNVLTVTLTNTPINILASELLTDEEYEHFQLLRTTKGNKPDLFSDYFGGIGGSVGNVDFEIPSHYLTDTDFAKVYAEAIKYLGYPYSWGGQSPSTSFDCSGFMYWIYNSTGVYSHSRLTAAGYYNLCTKFGAEQRQAGDFIFFTGTSNHATISHIGMYVGDGMMIHSASAGVSFAPVDSGYWAGSVYVCYGRLPI